VRIGAQPIGHGAGEPADEEEDHHTDAGRRNAQLSGHDHSACDPERHCRGPRDDPAGTAVLLRDKNDRHDIEQPEAAAGHLVDEPCRKEQHAETGACEEDHQARPRAIVGHGWHVRGIGRARPVLNSRWDGASVRLNLFQREGRAHLLLTRRL